MARDYKAGERLLQMRDVLDLGGSWTIAEVMECFGISETTASRYIWKLADVYDLEATELEATTRPGQRVKSWSMREDA